jgi:putative flippase GtrA
MTTGGEGTRAETARVPAAGGGPRAAVVRVIRDLWREIVGFGVVGTIGVSCDIAAFNTVLLVLHGPHVAASVAGTTLGTIVSYLGNKFWVFRKREQRQSGTELLLFILVSGVAIGITAGCVDFNDQVLHNHSVLSANIAQFIFGQGLGTIFRFWGCNRWVFPAAGGGVAGELEEDQLRLRRALDREGEPQSCREACG